MTVLFGCGRIKNERGEKTMSVEVSFMVGGEAGQGVQSVGYILAKSFARGGYYVFADQDYESRIRGGHSFYRVRTSDTEVNAILEPLNFLLALNRETVDLHRRELAPNGVIIFDPATFPPGSADLNGEGLFDVPLEKLAEAAGSKVMANTVALGVVLGLVGYDREILNRILRESFQGKDGSVGEANIKAAAAGYDYAQQNFKGKIEFHLSPVSDVKRMLLSGTDAIALGAIAAGCKFMAGYDPGDKAAAFDKAREWGDRIPIGVIYEQPRPIFEEQLRTLKEGEPLVKQKIDPSQAQKLIDELL